VCDKWENQTKVDIGLVRHVRSEFLSFARAWIVCIHFETRRLLEQSRLVNEPLLSKDMEMVAWTAQGWRAQTT